MGYKAINHILKHSHSTGTRRVVMVVLAEKGIVSWPSLTTIARLSNVSRPAVKAAIRSLESTGELLVVKPNKRKCIYVITCGFETKSIVKILTTHSKLKWSMEDATTIAQANLVIKSDARKVEATRHAEQILDIAKARNSKKVSKGCLTTASKAGLCELVKQPLHEPEQPEVEPESTSKLALASDFDNQTLTVADATQPTPQNNTSRTDEGIMDFLDMAFDRLEKQANNPDAKAEATIRRWNLPPHLADICVQFVKLAHVPVMLGDKGKWAKGARDLHELGAQTVLAEALKKGRKDGLTLTWPGALTELCREQIATKVPVKPTVIYVPEFN